jgi:hypothetical protein
MARGKWTAARFAARRRDGTAKGQCSSASCAICYPTAIGGAYFLHRDDSDHSDAEPDVQHAAREVDFKKLQMASNFVANRHARAAERHLENADDDGTDNADDHVHDTL